MPRRLSELATAPLLAETIGLTDGDRRFFAKSLAEPRNSSPNQSFEQRNSPTGLRQPGLRRLCLGRPDAPIAKSSRTGSSEGLDDVLKTKHGVKEGFAPDRRALCQRAALRPESRLKKRNSPSCRPPRVCGVMRSPAAESGSLRPDSAAGLRSVRQARPRGLAEDR